MQPRPRAVLLDCDGVLVDSEPITMRVLRDDLAQRGLDLTLPEVTKIFFGGTVRGDAVEAAKRGAHIEEGWVEQFYAKAYAALADEVTAIPGASELADQLADAGIAMAVASNGAVEKMRITLGRTGLLDRLRPHLYSAHDMEHPKPAPDVYLHAALQLDVAPRECVVIEDSAMGARAARAAGMRCIGFAAEGQGGTLAPYCDHVVGDMGAVARLLGVRA